MRLIALVVMVMMMMSQWPALAQFAPGELDVFVAPDGNDAWSGRLLSPNMQRNDGPAATLQAAVQKLRAIRKDATPARIVLKAGEYRLATPLEIGSEDSNLTLMAYPGDRVILHASQPLAGWAQTQVNGVAAWVCSYAGDPFRSLFVNGASRTRPRFPKITPGSDGGDDFLRIESVPGLDANGALTQSADKFVLKEGDFIARRNLRDVEIVAMHLWIASRFPAAAFDPQTRLFTSTHQTPFKLAEGWGEGAVPARYYIDNVFEAMREPGEWYLDREAGKVYYIPRAGETLANANIEIGAGTQLLRINGSAEKPVSGVHLQGIVFTRSDWGQPSVTGEAEEKRTGIRLATSWQAETNLPGVVELTHCRDVLIEDCEFSHLGYTALRIGDGCQEVRLERSHLHHLGGGGVHINGGDAKSPESLRTRKISVIDNHIEQGGLIFHAAVGVLSRHAANLVIHGNHIHDFHYSGISCGWVWGYEPSVSRDNLIASNYIHSLGQRWLSDMGGIYMLGQQPGTVIRGNIVHDINSAQYGGWAYYFDEGSSDILMQNNIGFGTTSQAVHLHYGRDIRVVNNILASGADAVIATSRQEPHTGLRLERNILLTNGKPVFLGQFANKDGNTPPRYVSNQNLIWDVSGKLPVVGEIKDPKPWAEWTKLGHDSNSVLVDPRLPDQLKLFGPVDDARKLDLRPPADSPANAVGFVEIRR